jgi:hypothetical protein
MNISVQRAENYWCTFIIFFLYVVKWKFASGCSLTWSTRIVTFVAFRKVCRIYVQFLKKFAVKNLAKKMKLTLDCDGDVFNFYLLRVPGYRSRGPGFDSRRHQIFWKVVGLERGSLSLVSTIEELLGRNSSGSGLENREYGRGDPLGWPRDTLYPQKLALTSPTSGGHSVCIVRLRTKVTEFLRGISYEFE